VQRLPSERPKHAVALETCTEINKYKIYAKFTPFPNNNNLVTYHKILSEPDAEQKRVKRKCAQAREHMNNFKAYDHTFLFLDFLTCLLL
jgi:tryptophanyl-tRNA synthetase